MQGELKFLEMFYNSIKNQVFGKGKGGLDENVFVIEFFE